MLRKRICILLGAVILAVSCAGCGFGTQPTVDPYAGMVQVESGYGTKMWVKLHENIRKSDFAEEDFSRRGGKKVYTGDTYETLTGIDVSEHQQEIDWAAVKEDGVDFAMIRLGYRGYSEGGLFLDKFFFENMNGAIENDIDIGIYFFSQAVNEEEAVKEAEFVLEKLSVYAPEDIKLPIYFDWETIDDISARTNQLEGSVITDCALAFCDTISAAGYETGIYAYRYLAYFSYDLERIAHLPLWMSTYGDYPDYYYYHTMWQYSNEGSVDGISGDVDMNLLFIEKENEKTEP